MAYEWDFFKRITDKVKDKSAMFLIGLIFVVYMIIKTIFEIEWALAIGITLVGIYGPWLLFDWIMAKRNRERFAAENSPTKFCPQCGARALRTAGHQFVDPLDISATVKRKYKCSVCKKESTLNENTSWMG